MAFPRIASLKTYEDFVGRVAELGIDLPCDRDVLQGRPVSLWHNHWRLTVLRSAIVSAFCRWKAGMEQKTESQPI